MESDRCCITAKLIAHQTQETQDTKEKPVYPPAFSWTCIFNMPSKLFCKARERSVEGTKNKKGQAAFESDMRAQKHSLATSKKIEEKRRSVGVCLVSASWRFILLLKSLWAETEHPLRGDEQANAQQAETNHSPTPKLEGRKEKGLGSSSKQHIPT